MFIFFYLKLNASQKNRKTLTRGSDVMQSKVCSMSAIIKVTLISAIMIAALIICSVSADALSGTTGNIKAATAVRASASVKGKQVGSFGGNAKVTIIREKFTTKKSTKKTKIWYYVTDGKTTGYVRSDMVGNISYSKTPVKVKVKTKARKGAGDKMKKKGTYKKGKSLTVVMEAKAKNGSTWYKVKKGSGYAYIKAKHARVTGKTTSPATNTAAAKASPAAAAPSLPAADPSAPLSITTSNVRLPEDRVTNLPFSIMGTVSSNHIIQKAEVGITDSSDKWVRKATADVNSTVFNIASVDAQIKFGTLTPGTYTYKVRVKVDGKWSTQASKKFKVRKAVVPAQLTQTALSLAWPRGTSSSVYSYSGGSPTPNFVNALNTVYPDRSNWSAAPKAGASCDVFVGTTVRTSGYDPYYPRGWDDQYSYLQASDKWVRIAYSGSLSTLQSGDIILYKRSSGGCHTCIYVEIDGTPYLAEAQISRNYGYLNSSTSKIQKFSDKKLLVVYRATN